MTHWDSWLPRQYDWQECSDNYDWDYDYDYDYDYDCYESTCEWTECDAHDYGHGNDDCWIEECIDCNYEYECTLWFWHEESYEWIMEDCHDPTYDSYDSYEEDGVQALETAAVVAMAFNDTAMATFDHFCTNGTCVNETVAMVDQQTGASQVAAAVYGDDGLKHIIRTALDDANEAFGVDVDNHHDVVDAETTEEAMMVVQNTDQEWYCWFWFC